MQRRILAFGALALVLSGCSANVSGPRTTVTTTASGAPAPTFSAPSWTSVATQSPGAAQPIKPPQTKDQSAPPPTVVSPSTNKATGDMTLTITSVGLTSKLGTVKKDAKGITPPPKALSWYDGSAKPGEQGTTVILGYTADLLKNAKSVKTKDTVVTGGVTYEVASVRTIEASAVSSDTGIWNAGEGQNLSVIALDGSHAVIISAKAQS